jgi:hypothetical protein
MKRLRRIAWNGLAAMSTLLCLATTLVWIRSYYIWDRAYIEVVEPGTNGSSRIIQNSVYTLPSVIYLGQFYYLQTTSRPDRGPLVVQSFPQRVTSWDGRLMRPPRWKFLRSAWSDTGKEYVGNGQWLQEQDLVIPDWLLVFVFSVVPIIWSRRARRAVICRKTPSYSCLNCGYDLRATPTKCPECGNVPAGMK